MIREDEAWVRRLYEENASRMYRIAVRRLGDPELAGDAVQEAFVALVSKVEAVRAHPNPEGWLMQALKYVMLQQIEAEQRRMDREQPLDAVRTAASEGTEPPLGDLLPAGLTPRERELLIWHYGEQRSYEEIAARLGIPVLTCRTRMFRARRHCRRLAEQEDRNLEEK